MDTKKFIREFFELAAAGKVATFAPLLPLFRIGEEHLSTELHFQLSPMYRFEQPGTSVYMCGRQIGKCVHENSLVYLANGRPLRAGDVREGMKILSADAAGHLQTGTVVRVMRSGIKPLLRLATRTRTIEVSPDHRLLTEEGYRTAAELQPGDHLLHCLGPVTFRRSTQPISRVRLTALLLGDGYLGETITLTTGSAHMLQYVSDFCRKNSIPFSVGRPYRGRTVFSIKFIGGRRRPIKRWLKKDGLLGRRSADKFIPDWVFNLPRRQTIDFLSHLWATDGCITRTPAGFPEISYCSISLPLIEQVQALLFKFGIPTKYRSHLPRCNGKFCARAYELRVETKEGKARFLDLFHVPDKPAVPILPRRSNNNRYTIPKKLVNPLIRDLFRGIRYKRDRSLRFHHLHSQGSYSFTKPTIEKYLKLARELGLHGEPAYRKLARLVSMPAVFEPILKIETTQPAPTMDFEVDPLHNFILNGIVSHNSLGFTAQILLRGHFHKGFHSLVIQPRADQLKRYNQAILRPMMRESLLGESLASSSEVNNLFVKELASGSLVYLEYAYLNPERVRGISGISSMHIDEASDIQYDFLPVIRETMSASRRYGFSQYTGTPKTSDGTLAVMWEDSSQAEWCVPCRRCTRENIPSIGQDLLKMIGKRTCVCAKCGRPLDCRNGFYLHARPDRAAAFAGYHVSQVTHPLHYGIKPKWQDLRQKMGNYSKAKFYNEVLGVPCDESVKLLTTADLIAAALPEPNDYEKARAARHSYEGYVMGVDWSGGGELEQSYTALAVVGFRSGTETLDCLYAERLPIGLSPEEEAQLLLRRVGELECVYLAHDYGGAGYVRESLLRQAGLPAHRIAPFTYVHSSVRDVITYNPPLGGVRYSYSIDKARSLAVLCAMIRARKVRLPRYDEQSRQVLDDLLALVEMPKELPRGSTLYLIGKAPKRPDDFAHALNYACSAVWHTRQCYPRLMDINEKFKMTPDQEIEAGLKVTNWEVRADE